MINLNSIKLYILSILKSPRLWALSLKYFVICLLSLVAIPVSCSIVVPSNANWDQLGPAVTILVLGITIAGICGLISLITGMISARQKKIVLFWVIPLFVTAIWFSLLGIMSPFRSDDIRNVIGIWFVSTALIGFIVWMLDILQVKNFVHIPWKSVPLWGIVVSIFIIIAN